MSERWRPFADYKRPYDEGKNEDSINCRDGIRGVHFPSGARPRGRGGRTQSHQRGRIPAGAECRRSQFEHASGHKLTIKFVDGPAVKREIDAGEIFDVVVSLAPALDDFVGQGKIVAGTHANIARRGVGVSVAVGAPKLDISSVEAVKRTLLAAKTVAHSAGGSAGVYFKSLLERLGIAEQTKAKLKPMPGSTAAEAIVNGEADLLVAGNAETMVPGVQPVGLLPTALQNYIVFAARVVVATQHPEAAKDLIKSLAAAEAAQVITAKGMEPAVP